MATESTLIPLGTVAPDFALPDVTTGRTVRRDDVAAGRPLLVIFLCRHCPYVKHVTEELVRLGSDYGTRAGVAGISANDAAAYPDDAPPSLAEMARESGFTFPVLYDETQDVARAYGAVCTPDSFLFDAGLRLVYHGRLDETRPRSGAIATGADIRRALDSVLSGEPVPADQHAALGCSIKWR